MAIERTFSMIKPDATKRNLTGAITKMLEDAGLRVVASKRVWMSKREAEGFYAVHKERPFFGELVDGMTSGPTIVAEFENPQGGTPLVLNQKVFPMDDKISVQSENLHCVVKDRPYSVTVKLVDKDGKLLQELKAQFKSDLDQTVLPSKPLVVGAGYEKNPEVFKPDGTTDFSNTDKCPA